MQPYLNKNLLKPFIVLLTAFNVLPVGLVSVANMDILKLISILILFSSLFQFKGFFNKELRFITLFIFSIFLSAANMISKGKYMDWTLFYCLNYLNLYLLLLKFESFHDINNYIQVLVGLCISAFVVHLVFYLEPSLLVGELNEIRMGSINMDATKLRVFIPGMVFIALFFNYYILKLLYFKRLTIIESFLIFIFFISIFILASVRTYLLGIPVTFVVLLIVGRLSIKKLAYFFSITAAGLLLLSLLSSDMYNFFLDRFDIFLKLSDFNLVNVIQLDVDYDNEQTFGTVYFRIMEVVYVLQNFSNDWRAILFGNIGTLYDFLGVEQETAPHISIFGIYYLFGLFGLSTFFLFFIYYSKLVIHNLKKFKNTNQEFLSLALTIFWFTLFIISFFGGIYYSEAILLVTFIIAASITLKNSSIYERTKD